MWDAQPWSAGVEHPCTLTLGYRQSQNQALRSAPTVLSLDGVMPSSFMESKYSYGQLYSI